MREFETGSTRNDDTEALDFEGFLSVSVLFRYAEYMHKHRKQKDGKLRDSDNWQKGIPLNSYMKSGLRHTIDWWLEHRTSGGSRDGLEDALCAVIFNACGYLHEILKNNDKKVLPALESITEIDKVSCSLCNKRFLPGERAIRWKSEPFDEYVHDYRCPTI